MKKNFYVIAYDITDDKRRYRVVKILESVATRINYSVFECMLTQNQYKELVGKLTAEIQPKDDHIVFYPVCRRCFSRINYLFSPSNQAKESVIVV